MAFNHLVKPLSRLLRSEPGSYQESLGKSAANTAAHPSGDEAGSAAVLQLADGEELRRLAGVCTQSDVPPPVELAARQRLAHLIDAGTIDFNEFLSAATNIDAALVVAGLCAVSDYLPRAIDSIATERLSHLVINGTTSRIRQLAAQRIEDPPQLKDLLNQLRGKDKSAYKIIKQKCDALHAEEQRISHLKIDVESAYASLERHSHRIHDAVYEPTFEHFAARWRTLEPAADRETLERAHQAIARCQEIIAEHARKLLRRAADESQRAAEEAAREAAVARAALETERRNEELALAREQASRAREAEEKHQAEKAACEAAVLRQVRALLGSAHLSLREGNTARAAGLKRAIESKLSSLAPIPVNIASQVQQLDAKLNELKEWKDFAVAPKRQELIAQMQALIGSIEQPRMLADRIKQLQEDWKTVSKGIVSDSEEDWQHFHAAAQSAYQPCREYFEAQSQLRHANAEKRKCVLERVYAFERMHSGADADWRAVATVLREAPQEFRRHAPVERAANRELQESFDAAMNRLQARLGAWHAENAESKRALILRAQHFSAKVEGQEAVDGIKRLQQLWKEIGPAQRDQEQPLWNEFRAQCDAVFQRRQKAHLEFAAVLESNKRTAVSLCERAEQAATLSGAPLIEGIAAIPQWRAEFAALGDLRGLKDRFERAVKLCQSKLTQQRAAEKRQSVARLFEAARRIQAYGWAVAQQAAPEGSESLKQAAEGFIAGVAHWPKGGLAALKDAWAKAHTATTADADAHETALRALCIRREIGSGRDTPPEDQALRREYQMQRLIERMGQAQADSDDAEALALEWIRVGPVAPARYDSLLARFVGTAETHI